MQKLIALLLLVSLSFTAQAQITRDQDARPPRAERAERGDRPSPEERVERQTTRLAQKLELSEEQTAQLLAINKRYAAERTAAREEQQNRNRQLAQEQKQRQDVEIQSILTAEQKADYAKLKEEMKAKKEARQGERKERGNRGGRRGGGNR